MEYFNHQDKYKSLSNSPKKSHIRHGISSMTGNQCMLSNSKQPPIQRTKWQYHASRNEENRGWFQINLEARGAHPLPQGIILHGMIFDDQTGKKLGVAKRYVVGAGSGYNEAVALAEHRLGDSGGGLTLVTDLQSQEDLAKYPRYQESMEMLSRERACFMPNIDGTASYIKAKETHVPFIETGNRNPRYGPLTSQVVHDLFQRQDQLQDSGHRIYMKIYTGHRSRSKNATGKRATPRFGRRYRIRDAAIGTHYQLIRRQRLREIPLHEKTKDHSQGVPLTKETTRMLTFEKGRDVTEDMDDPKTDAEEYTGL